MTHVKSDTSPRGSTRWLAAAAVSLILLCVGLPDAVGEPLAKGTPGQELATGTPAAERFTFMVEIDPMPFALSGHAVHLRLALPSVPGLVLGAGTYAMEFPALLTNINSKNRDEGWQVDIDQAYATFVDYHLSGKPEGLFVGAQLAYQRFELARDQSDQRREFGVVIAMARVGTLWRPTGSGFYLLPWAGVYANIRTDDRKLDIGDQTFDVAPVAGFATLHLGWQFQ